MPVCNALTSRGSPCKRHACKNNTLCPSHLKPNREEKPMKSEQSSKQCLYKGCVKSPTVDTPNGKCCVDHEKMYSLERPEECVICMDALNDNQEPFACGHWVHKACFMECKKLSCPMCRSEVRLPRDEYLQWKAKHNIITSGGVSPRRLTPALSIQIGRPPRPVMIDFVALTNQLLRRPRQMFDLANVPFEHIRELLTFETYVFSHFDLMQSTMIISSVYPELNLTSLPYVHVLRVLMRNGYQYMDDNQITY